MKQVLRFPGTIRGNYQNDWRKGLSRASVDAGDLSRVLRISCSDGIVLMAGVWILTIRLNLFASHAFIRSRQFQCAFGIFWSDGIVLMAGVWVVTLRLKLFASHAFIRSRQFHCVLGIFWSDGFVLMPRASVAPRAIWVEYLGSWLAWAILLQIFLQMSTQIFSAWRWALHKSRCYAWTEQTLRDAHGFISLQVLDFSVAWCPTALSRMALQASRLLAIRNVTVTCWAAVVCQNVAIESVHFKADL